jgi:hypothetical protein
MQDWSDARKAEIAACSAAPPVTYAATIAAMRPATAEFCRHW